jgi:hypothetical protein
VSISSAQLTQPSSLTLLSFASLDANDDDYFNFGDNLEKNLVEESFAPSKESSARHKELIYAQISNLTHFYQWLEGPFVNALATLDPKVIALGGVRIGQLRVRTRDCTSDAQEWGWFNTSTVRGVECKGSGRGHFDLESESRADYGHPATPFTWAGWNGTDTASERTGYYTSDESR